MVTHDVAHHDVVEAHGPVTPQALDDRVGAAHEQLIESRAAIPFGKDGSDDGARLLVGLADIDVTAQDGTRYVSFADWICPTHCIEPALCPAIGAPRTWEMGDAVRALAERLRGAGRPVAGPALFVCRHHVFGVGTFAGEAVLAGDRLVAEAGASGAPAEVLVGTISSCHGALNLLSLGGRDS